MINSSIAHPYAVALYEMAKSSNTVNQWFATLKNLDMVVNTPEFKAVMGNPEIERKQVIDTLICCLEKPSNELKNFLELVGSNNRFDVFSDIFVSFENLYKEDNQVATAIIESAFSMNDEDKLKIEKILSSKFGKTITADVKVNSDLIGGIKIIIDDVVIDASIMGSLNKMATELKR